MSSFPDSVSFAIDEERRRLFEGLGAMFEGYFVLTVTWFPPVLAQRKFVELMFDDDAVAPDHTARTTGLIAQFKREITSLESRLSSAVKMTRLRGQKVVSEEGREVTHDDFLSWLQFCVTGLHHPVMLPSNPMYLDAYLGSLPGHGVENVRRPLINTMNLADLLPTSSIWTGSATAPCPMYPPLSPALMHCVTVGATPFRLNLHVRDLGHTFMFGPTGAGKSTHLGIIAAQLRRYAGMSIYAFDKGMSMYPLAAGIRAATKGKSGLHFTVAADDDRLAFCPLQFLETKGDRAWAMEWIDTILALNGVNTTPAQRNEIGNAIMSMHASGARTLSEFSVTIQDEAIREAIKQYTVDGSMGHLLDAEEDGLSLSDFTVFEIEELMNLGEKFARPGRLYQFRRLERALKGQPSVIILDEAWLMLGHPAFRAKIREWLKVLRKANCLVLMATQSLSDAANSGILDVIVESTATKIFLPNVYARDEDTSALYRRMGLNARQIEILATAIPKRQYYYVSENGRRLYDLALGPMALAFVGASDKESVATIKSLEAKFGHEWVHEWLAGRGLNLNDYLEAA
ncbi:TraG/VirB4 family ATPase [Achromobacter insolitus]